jgi:transposase
MASRKRRSFSAEFKQEAVRLVKESGRPLAQVARELDLDKSVLRSWQQAMEGEPAVAQRLTEREELRRLRRENARLKLEQEILKKAMAFFANDGR